MKLWMQKLISILMCLTLFMSFGVTALAGGEEETQEVGQETTQAELDELERIRLEELEKKRLEEELRRQQEAAAKAAQETAEKAAPVAETPVKAAPGIEAAPVKEVKTAPAKEAVPVEEVKEVKEVTPDKSTAPTEEPVKVVPASDVLAEEPNEQQSQNENNEEPVVVKEEPEQEQEPVEDENTLQDEFVSKAEKTIKTEVTAKADKPTEASPPLQQEETVKTDKPAENTQPAEDTQPDEDGQNAKDVEQTKPEEVEKSDIATAKRSLNFAPKSMFLRDAPKDDGVSLLSTDAVSPTNGADEIKTGATEVPDGLADTVTLKSSSPFAKAGTAIPDGAGTTGAEANSSTTPAASTDTTAKDAKTVIEVDGTKYSNDKDIPFSPEEVDDSNGDPMLKGIGWSAEDGTLTITNETLKELTVKEGDLTIQATGLNRINKLVSNNVVNIIGTGIMLLDDVDLKESGEVQLTQTTINGTTGSVAVFLKDKNAAGNTYNLINGSVPGLLDEKYTIPEGINLVMPSGTKIIMDSVSKAEGEEEIKENSSALTISKGASLTVENGAVIETNSKEGFFSEYVATIDGPETAKLTELTPKIQVENGGKMTVKGKFASTTLGKAGMIETTGKTLIEKLGKSEVTYAELVQIFKELYGVSFAKPSFIILDEDGNKTLIDSDHSTTESGELVRVPFKPGSHFGCCPYTGAGLAGHNLGITSSGILASEGSFKPTGKPTTILKIEEKILWRVIVTENPRRGTWTLSVWYGDTQIFDLGVTTVRARFKFDKPDEWDTKNIYVVFIDKDGKSLKAFPATYNTVTGELVFDSSLVGEFVVVQFDYQGELYSKGFYDELAKLDAVKHLVDLHSGKAI